MDDGVRDVEKPIIIAAIFSSGTTGLKMEKEPSRMAHVLNLHLLPLLVRLVSRPRTAWLHHRYPALSPKAVQMAQHPT